MSGASKVFRSGWFRVLATMTPENGPPDSSTPAAPAVSVPTELATERNRLFELVEAVRDAAQASGLPTIPRPDAANASY